MMQHPRKFSYFINTCTGIDHHHRPVEIVCSHSSKGNCQTPHTYRKAVHIKQRISSSAKNSINRHIVDCTPDHIKCDNYKHSFQICSCLWCQFHEMQNNWRCDAHQKRCHNSTQTGYLQKTDPVFFSTFQITGSKLISNHDTGCTGNSRTQAPDHGLQLPQNWQPLHPHQDVP